jgi:arsenite methyltransferase
MTQRIDYGIDAPGVIRNLFLIGVACSVVAALSPFHVGATNVDLRGFWFPGVIFVVEAGLMLLYSLHGKFRHRDRMLATANLRGDESVLDIGTGRGLMLVGAAKRLTTGRAVGLDIWKTSDLSGNAREKTEKVLEQEGVADRCKLLERPAQDTGLPDASFDVILSNLCLHNISSRKERDAACREIVRMLKPGGVAVISDYKNTGQYAAVFRSAGLTVQRSFRGWDTFPPLLVIEARKPKDAEAKAEETAR